MMRQIKRVFHGSYYDQVSAAIPDHYTMRKMCDGVMDLYVDEAQVGVIIVVYDDQHHDPHHIEHALDTHSGVTMHTIHTDFPHIPDGLPKEHANHLHDIVADYILNERVGLVTQEERERMELLQRQAIDQGSLAVAEFVTSVRDIVDLDVDLGKGAHGTE